MSNKKKNVTVSISQLEEAFHGIDPSEFEPGETYPMSTLLDALRPRPRHERWGLIELEGDETLKCHSCDGCIRNQRVHILLNVDGEVEEVMCAFCWKEKQKEKRI